MGSNSGLASVVTSYAASCGSWNGLLDEMTALESVTADDVLRVSQQLFNPSRCIVAHAVNRGAGA